jgi:tetratricopeptide (TPR) repeat protein
LFQLLQAKPANTGGTAALGALQQAALVPAPTLPLDVGPAPITAVAPRASETGNRSDVQLPSAPAASNRASSGVRKEGVDREEVSDPSDPSGAKAFVDQGMALFKDGRLGLAEASYLKALKVQPGYARAMAALVRVHIERRDGAEAVRWAKQLVEQQPENGANLLLLGDAQQLRGDLSAARDAWSEAADYGNATARERL